LWRNKKTDSISKAGFCREWGIGFAYPEVKEGFKSSLLTSFVLFFMLLSHSSKLGVQKAKSPSAMQKGLLCREWGIRTFFSKVCKNAPIFPK
jgi:hypothetical protein